ncbi:MAG: homocysteine S-methyltransferase family protein [Armatimonadetes bacterium]|nr:homocysteine S-methyltransferase family protein [Armatimonadota bacterium]
MKPTILQAARERILVCEGAMGTMLARKGLRLRNTAEANLTHPDVVAEIHREYYEAGARVFQTNTFSANRAALERAGLAEHAGEIQAAAVRIVRQAVGPDTWIAANLGPTGELIEPLGDLTMDEAISVYRLQLEAMVPEGVDFILAETFEALEEAEAALMAARQVAPDLPVAITMSFSLPNGRTSMGVSGEEAARRLVELGADIIGANCGHPDGLLKAFSEMAEVAGDRVLMAQPNAGVPRLVGGETVFDASPQWIGEMAARLIEAGARIVGGCCGTTPDHVVQIARAATAAA